MQHRNGHAHLKSETKATLSTQSLDLEASEQLNVNPLVNLEASNQLNLSLLGDLEVSSSINLNPCEELKVTTSLNVNPLVGLESFKQLNIHFVDLDVSSSLNGNNFVDFDVSSSLNADNTDGLELLKPLGLNTHVNLETAPKPQNFNSHVDLEISSSLNVNPLVGLEFSKPLNENNFVNLDVASSLNVDNIEDLEVLKPLSLNPPVNLEVSEQLHLSPLELGDTIQVFFAAGGVHDTRSEGVSNIVQNVNTFHQTVYLPVSTMNNFTMQSRRGPNGEFYIFNGDKGFCYICSVELSSQQQCLQHVQGSKHLKKEKESVYVSAQAVLGNAHPTVSSKLPVQGESSLGRMLGNRGPNGEAYDVVGPGGRCFVCCVDFTSVELATQHLAGQKHKKKAASQLFETAGCVPSKIVGSGQTAGLLSGLIRSGQAAGYVPSDAISSGQTGGHFPSGLIRSGQAAGHVPSDAISSGQKGHFPSGLIRSGQAAGHVPSDAISSGQNAGHFPSGFIRSGQTVSHYPLGAISSGPNTGYIPPMDINLHQQPASSRSPNRELFIMKENRGFCYVCNLDLTSPSHAQSHLAGKKHKKKSLEEINSNASVNKTDASGVLMCSICNVPFSSIENATQHFESDKHKKKEKLLKSGNHTPPEEANETMDLDQTEVKQIYQPSNRIIPLNRDSHSNDVFREPTKRYGVNSFDHINSSQSSFFRTLASSPNLIADFARPSTRYSDQEIQFSTFENTYNDILPRQTDNSESKSRNGQQDFENIASSSDSVKNELSQTATNSGGLRNNLSETFNTSAEHRNEGTSDTTVKSENGQQNNIDTDTKTKYTLQDGNLSSHVNEMSKIGSKKIEPHRQYYSSDSNALDSLTDNNLQPLRGSSTDSPIHQVDILQQQQRNLYHHDPALPEGTVERLLERSPSQARRPSLPNVADADALAQVFVPYYFDGYRGCCYCCTVELTSLQHANQHLYGQKHQKKLGQWMLTQALQKGPSPQPSAFHSSSAMDSQINVKADDGSYYFNGSRGFCQVCNIELTSFQHMQQHINGKPHRRSHGRFSLSQKGVIYPLNCTICRKIFTGQESAKQHFTSIKHKSKTEVMDDSVQVLMHVDDGRVIVKDGQTWFYCDVCKVPLNTREQFIIHKDSPKHRRESENYMSRNSSSPATVQEEAESSAALPGNSRAMIHEHDYNTVDVGQCAEFRRTDSFQLDIDIPKMEKEQSQHEIARQQVLDDNCHYLTYGQAPVISRDSSIAVSPSIRQNSSQFVSPTISQDNSVIVTPNIRQDNSVTALATFTRDSSMTAIPTFTQNSSVTAIPTFTRDSSVTAIPTFTRDSSVTALATFTRDSSMTAIPTFTQNSSVTAIPTFTQNSSVTPIPTFTRDSSATTTTSALQLRMTPRQSDGTPGTVVSNSPSLSSSGSYSSARSGHLMSGSSGTSGRSSAFQVDSVSNCLQRRTDIGASSSEYFSASSHQSPSQVSSGSSQMFMEAWQALRASTGHIAGEGLQSTSDNGGSSTFGAAVASSSSGHNNVTDEHRARSNPNSGLDSPRLTHSVWKQEDLTEEDVSLKQNHLNSVSRSETFEGYQILGNIVTMPRPPGQSRSRGGERSRCDVLSLDKKATDDSFDDGDDDMKDRENFNIVEDEPIPKIDSPEAVQSKPLRSDKHGFLYYCDVCNKHMNTREAYDSHVKGKNHLYCLSSSPAPIRQLDPIRKTCGSDNLVHRVCSMINSRLHIIPRSYQLELVEKAMAGDSIIYLPTGTGKTLVAVLTMGLMLQENKSRPVLFLVDKVLLVMQQAQYIMNHFVGTLFSRQDGGQDKMPVDRELKVKPICGGLTTKTDLPIWKHDIVVTTAAYCFNMLNRGLIRWEDFSLVVLDEVHHCNKGHPYHKLMSNYHSSLSEVSRAKVLGLTASPAGKSTVEQTYIMLSNLLNNLGGATIAVVETEQAVLDKFQSMAQVQAINVPMSSKEEDFKRHLLEYFILCYSQLAVMTRSLQSDAPPCSFFLQAVNNPGNREIATELANQFIRDPEPLAEVLSVIYNATCIDETNWECKSRFNDLKFHICNLLLVVPEVGSGADIDELLTTLSPSQTIEEFKKMGLPCQQMFQHVQNFAEDGNKDLTMFTKLVETLQNPDVIDWSDTSCRALVLVRERKRAKQYSVRLKEHQMVTKKNLHIGHIVGHGKGARDGGMDLKKQRKVFDNHERYHILVATSIMEEGIDIQALQLVVCMNPPNSLRALVQMRGRARREGSHFVVLCSSQEDVEKLEQLQRQEGNMLEATKQFLKERR